MHRRKRPSQPFFTLIVRLQCVACLLYFVATQVAWAAPVTVRAELSEATIYLGESVRLELRISGLRDPEPPVLSHPDIDISSEGGQSFSNSSISIINGRTSRVEDFGYVARYRLRPRTTGRLAIPAIAVTHEGQTYYSQPLTLVVQALAEQDDLLVEVYTDKPSYVLGERITLILDLSLRKLTTKGKELDVDPFFRESPPHLQIPWFEGLGDWKTTALDTFVQPFLDAQRPGFSINDYYDQRNFFRSERLTFALPRHSTSRTRPTGTFAYFTYRLQKVFQPLHPGVRTIPPVLVKATLPTEIDARGRALQTQKVIASSQPFTVEVRPIPSAGQPASFSGAVGRFHLAVAATPTTLKVGDPLTFTVSIRREGDSLLETVHPLPLQEQSALARDFKIDPDPSSVQSTEDSKTFTYTLRPRHADVRAVPPIDMAYYDPEAGEFQVVYSQAVPLQVERVSTLDPSEVVVTSEASSKSRLGQQLAEGLLANYTGAEVLVPQWSMLRITPVLGGLLILPPIAYVLALLGRQWQRQRRHYAGRQRRRRAARTALATLHTLKRRQDRSEASICEDVYRALIAYISDKLELTYAGLTVDDVTHHLHQQGLEQDLINHVEALFHLCDSARYAPGTLAVAQLTELIEEADALVRRLEAGMQR
jgi:hypothetical protein